MTDFNWNTATARERDAWIAENVMGWTNVRLGDGSRVGLWVGCPPGEIESKNLTYRVQDYTTDAGDDDLVLQHINDDNWFFDSLNEFAHQWASLLDVTGGDRLGFPLCLTNHRAGFISHAVYLTIKKLDIVVV